MYRKKSNCRIESGPLFLISPKQIDNKGEHVVEKVIRYLNILSMVLTWQIIFTFSFFTKHCFYLFRLNADYVKKKSKVLGEHNYFFTFLFKEGLLEIQY